MPGLERRRSALAPRRGTAVLGRHRGRPARRPRHGRRRQTRTTPHVPALLALFRASKYCHLGREPRPLSETEVWTWAADQRVAFVIRWQAHEALMHRIGTELVNGAATPIEPALASDGIDAALTLVYGDLPSWSTFSRLRREWSDRSASPGDDRGRSSSVASPAPARTPATPTTRDYARRRRQPQSAVVHGACRRDRPRPLALGTQPATHLEVDGAPDAFARLEQLVAAGIQ